MAADIPGPSLKGTDSTLLLFNHSLDGPKKFEVLIGNGKQLWVGSYKLASMETKAVKINEIVERQIPDATGTKLSRDILTGQVGWWTHRATWGKGRLMVSQPQSGMARSFSCGTCANLCGAATVYPDDFATFPIGTTGNLGNASFQQCLATCGQCGGTVQGPASETPTWSSLNTSIATVYSGVHSAMASFRGMAAGTTTGQVTAQDEGCTAQRQGPVTVTPAISGPSTVWWFNGQNPNSSSYPVSVTLTSSAGASTTWSVTQTDTKVSLSSTSGASITVTSTGSKFSAASGDISIKATANGVASSPFTMTARTPWKLSLISRDTVQDATYTYITNINYNVLDNLSSVIADDINWNEGVGACQSVNGSNRGTICIQTSPGSTGPLTDVLSGPQLSRNPSPTPQFHNPPTGTTAYETVAQTIQVGSSTTGAGVLAQTDTLTYYLDQGNHTGITAPPQPPN
jgi:hypothetical protein